MCLILPRDGSSHLTVYLVMGGGALNILRDRVGFPWGGQDCLGPLYVSGAYYRQSSLIRYRYITIYLVLRSTPPDQAFFGVNNDNLTFDDIVKLYHQYRYN